MNIEQDKYQYEFIKSQLDPSDFCLDIGANEGYYTQLMADEGAFVYAFEPDKYNFKTLEHNMKGENYFLLDQAVTNYTGYVKFYKCVENKGMHRIYASQWCVEDPTFIPCTTIDGLNLPRVDFVKIDVEGSELGVLEGMEKTINKFKPKMVIEFHPPSLEEYDVKSPRKIYNFLKKYYRKIDLLATSYIPESKTMSDISFDELIQQTYHNPARNIFVSL